jgi:hypothetical protein
MRTCSMLLLTIASVILFACSSTATNDTPPLVEGGTPERDAGRDADVVTAAPDGGGEADAVAPPAKCATAWCPIDAPVTGKMRAAWSSGPADVWLGGEGGALLHFDGQALTPVVLPTTETITAISGSSATDIWIGTTKDQYTGTLFHGDGKTFAAITTSTYFFTKASYLAIWARSSEDVWFAKNTGGLVRREGTTWLDSGPAYDDAGYPDAIWGTGPADVWVADYYDTRHFDGQKWTKNGTGATSLWGAAANDLYAAGGGTLRHYDGNGWVAITPSPTIYPSAVRGSSATDVWAVGSSNNKGAIVHGVSGTWTTSTVPANAGALLALTIPSANVGWAVGDKTILRYAP